MGSGERIDDNISWATELEEAHTKKGNGPEGEGWKTFNQIQKEMKCGICKCRRIMQGAKREGEIEVFHGTEKSPTTGGLCRQIWYRPVKD